MTGAIQKKASEKPKTSGEQSITAIFNNLLDGQKLRGRFHELLGSRMPQFLGSMTTLLNTTPELQKAFYANPNSFFQSCLKAAVYDLPIDSSMGYAYVVPFKNKGQPEVTFILGWKGMHQLAMRTGVYKIINVTDVRAGELVSFNRMTEEIKFNWIEDEDQRAEAPVIGYVGYYRMINGAEKTVYMTKKQIEQHERRHRKGEYMGKVWKTDFDAMALKTVYRRLIGKWGIMSVEYQAHKEATMLAEQMAAEDTVEMDIIQEVEEPAVAVDEATGEVVQEVIADAQ